MSGRLHAKLLPLLVVQVETLQHLPESQELRMLKPNSTDTAPQNHSKANKMDRVSKDLKVSILQSSTQFPQERVRYEARLIQGSDKQEKSALLQLDKSVFSKIPEFRLPKIFRRITPIKLKAHWAPQSGLTMTALLVITHQNKIHLKTQACFSRKIAQLCMKKTANCWRHRLIVRRQRIFPGLSTARKDFHLLNQATQAKKLIRRVSQKTRAMTIDSATQQ